MVAIPQSAIESPTVTAIYRAYKDAANNYEGIGLSVGELGNECSRALWYGLRWVSEPEDIDGRSHSIFRTGDAWEDRLVNDLSAIGAEVTGQQDRIRLAGGHIRGKIDGRVSGVVEAPKTDHLLEIKSSNDKNFKDLLKKGVKESKPLHFVQCQLGMHMFGLTRALYLVVNKNTDERYAERVEYDSDFCMRLIAKAERLIASDHPPPRVSENPEFFKCRWCKHRAVCHESAMPRVTCRSCIHSTAETVGDALWTCARWQKPLGLDEQQQACPTHLFNPGLVPGTQIDVDEENETITYEMHDGTTWTDGGSNA